MGVMAIFDVFFKKNRWFWLVGACPPPPDPHSCCSWRWLACSLMSVRWLSDNVQKADSFRICQIFLLLCVLRDSNLHFYNLKGYISLVVPIADREENRTETGKAFYSFCWRFILKIFFNLATVAVDASQSFAVLAMLVPLLNSFRTFLYSCSNCSIVFLLTGLRPTLPPFDRKFW